MAPYMYKFSPCGWISLGTGCTGCPPWLYGFADFFASDALNLLFRANSALLNLLFRALLLDDDENHNAQRLDGKLNDHALQKQCEQRSDFHGLQRILHGL